MKLNQINTQRETTAIHTTNFRDCRELYHFDIFPDEYDFYTSDPEVKKKFEEKLFNYYYMNDLAWDQISIWKHYFKNLMAIENVRYKQIFNAKINELELFNVDIKEVIGRINEGEGSSTSLSDSESTGSSTGDNTTRDYDTPQGRIDPNKMDGHISGVTSADQKGTSMSSGSAKGTTENFAKNKEDTERTLKGYQGSKTMSELKKELLSVIINLDKQIINDCNKLFLNVW